MNTEDIKPCPRLELEWFKVSGSWHKRECIYSLVIPLEDGDIRALDKNGEIENSELKIKIGETHSTSSSPDAPVWNDGEVQAPFRDGAHAHLDSKHLGNIPIVLVCENVFTIKNIKEELK